MHAETCKMPGCKCRVARGLADVGLTSEGGSGEPMGVAEAYRIAALAASRILLAKRGEVR